MFSPSLTARRTSFKPSITSLLYSTVKSKSIECPGRVKEINQWAEKIPNVNHAALIGFVNGP